MGYKNERPVSFGMTLELPLSVPADARVVSYDLFAVVDHNGHYGSGHYTAFVRHPTHMEWRHVNDLQCTSVTHDQVLALTLRSAYMIMYMLRASSNEEALSFPRGVFDECVPPPAKKARSH
jgi:ubiquitin C-terminal hydrolase